MEWRRSHPAMTLSWPALSAKSSPYSRSGRPELLLDPVNQASGQQYVGLPR